VASNTPRPTKAERRAAARVAVDFGEDDAGERQHVVEGFGGVGGVLPGHAIDHEQGFYRFQLRVQGADFVHQRVVDVQASGGINDEDVKILALGVVESARGDVRRFFAGVRRNKGRADLFGKGFELFDGRRAIDVGGDQRHFFLFVDEFAREFGT